MRRAIQLMLYNTTSSVKLGLCGYTNIYTGAPLAQQKPELKWHNKAQTTNGWGNWYRQQITATNVASDMCLKLEAKSHR